MRMRIGLKLRKAGIFLGFVGGAALILAGLPVTTGIGICLVLGGVVLLWVDSISNGNGNDNVNGYGNGNDNAKRSEDVELIK